MKAADIQFNSKREETTPLLITLTQIYNIRGNVCSD
jgi:hypothetical protein